MKGKPVRTPEKVAQAKRMREQGMMLKEIGAHFGVSLKTIHDWVADTDRARQNARRARYSGACEWCGGATDGSDGPGRAPTICHGCLEWTPEAILSTFRDFYDEHGRPPRVHDRGMGLPSEGTVVRHLGSWVTAQQLAGVPILCDHRPTTMQAIFDALAAGESTKSVADRYGVTIWAIYQRLKIRGLRMADVRNGTAKLTPTKETAA